MTETAIKTRRRFLRDTAVAGSGLALSAYQPLADALSAPAAAKRPPNILYLLGEGVRPDENSLCGNTLLHTPNIDRIGREGAVFPNTFCTNALCLPARATCLTGMYSHTTGAIDNQHSKVPAQFPIISDLLRDAGYEIAFLGKSHVEGALMDRYWDYYFGFDGQANFYRPVITEGVKGVYGKPTPYPGQYVDNLLTAKAVQWLEQPREKPFALFLWFYAPHAPFYRPPTHANDMNGVSIPVPKSFGEFAEGYPDKPHGVRIADNKIGVSIVGSDDPRSLEELVKDHYVGVENNDENIGRLFTVLDRQRVMDDTAVLWSSDHGFFLGEHRFYDKRLMYEPSIRIPLMVRYPKRIKPGTGTSDMILNTDFVPTLLEWADVKVPAAVQGRSVMLLLDRKLTEPWRKDWLYEYYEYPGYENVRPNRGVRTEQYKYIHYFTDPQEYELYDLRNDPDEMKNLYGKPEYADLQQRLKSRLEALRRETHDTYQYTPTILLRGQEQYLKSN